MRKSDINGGTSMTVNWQDIIAWVIVGALSGSLAGILVTRKKEGFGHLLNLGVGMVGAVIGGVIFNIFNIGIRLAEISISLQDILAGFVGSLLLLFGGWIWKKRRFRLEAKQVKQTNQVKQVKQTKQPKADSTAER
jgi:uncharacterized membrane protein YeaQ/YmgE (transglycosylase-associated protein family)